MALLQTDQGLVQEMRRIREQISRDIQGLTLEQELAYFDQLLADPQRPEPKVDEGNLKRYRDLKNVIDTAREEGRKQGKAEWERYKTLETARKLKLFGMGMEVIVKATGLTIGEIETLR